MLKILLLVGRLRQDAHIEFKVLNLDPKPCFTTHGAGDHHQMVSIERFWEYLSNNEHFNHEGYSPIGIRVIHDPKEFELSSWDHAHPNNIYFVSINKADEFALHTDEYHKRQEEKKLVPTAILLGQKIDTSLSDWYALRCISNWGKTLASTFSFPVFPGQALYDIETGKFLHWVKKNGESLELGQVVLGDGQCNTLRQYDPLIP